MKDRETILAEADLAQTYYTKAQREGNPEPVYRQQEWNGQIYAWGEPPVGWCSEPGGGAPLVPDSHWVQLHTPEGKIFCRVK